MARVYLLTGAPGTGKTSLIKEAASGMKGRAGGFYTEEIREHGVRKGFRLVTLAGESATLAHVDFDSPHRVSKYGVDVASLERVGVPAISEAARQGNLVVVDEIGKMELFSEKFRDAVEKLVASGTRVLGTIMLSPHPWADKIKRHPGVKVVTLTRSTYREVLADVRHWLETEAQ